MSDLKDTWDANMADDTDVLVARVRNHIPRPDDKTDATKAIYAHVRKVKDDAASLLRRYASDVNEEIGPEIAGALRKALEHVAKKLAV